MKVTAHLNRRIRLRCSVGLWAVSGLLPTWAQSPEALDISAFDGSPVTQTPPVVHWRAEVDARQPLHPGSPVILSVSGDISDGWHVYAPRQQAGGPTPLTVLVAENPVARERGNATSGPSEVTHDASFDLDTRFYRRAVELRIPAVIKRQVASGQYVIPVDVRYQSCSERTCLPPTTVRLSAPVTVHVDSAKQASQ